jgi:hypothetical protein
LSNGTGLPARNSAGIKQAIRKIVKRFIVITLPT